MPVPIDERTHGTAVLREAILHALLRVEEGIEDGHVLPSHTTEGRRYSGKLYGSRTNSARAHVKLSSSSLLSINPLSSNLHPPSTPALYTVILLVQFTVDQSSLREVRKLPEASRAQQQPAQQNQTEEEECLSCGA